MRSGGNFFAEENTRQDIEYQHSHGDQQRATRRLDVPPGVEIEVVIKVVAFAAGDRDDSRVDVYIPEESGRTGFDLLSQMMSPPAFPITPEGLKGNWTFTAIDARARHWVTVAGSPRHVST